MIKFKILVLLTFMACLISCNQNQIMHVKSPNGSLSFNIQLTNKGVITYSVNKQLGNKTNISVIQESPLGIELQDQLFSTSLTFESASTIKPNIQEYTLKSGKRLKNKALANECIYSFKNKKGAIISIKVRVFDEGFAFRYLIPRDINTSYCVEKEITEFHIPTNGKAWIEPYDSLQKWGPGHEVGYENNIAIGTKSYKSTGWALPALFNYNNIWCLLSESAADTTYCVSHLSAVCNSGMYKLEFPWAHELYGKGEVTPLGIGSVQTPWRVGIVGTSLKTIVESNLIAHLARPCELKDTSWIKPGRASWSWWGDVYSPTNVPLLKKYIDFSAQMGWEYTLIDCNWHYIPDKEFENLAAYAKAKNVGLLLWYNSAGPYTKVYEVGPLNRVHTHELRVKEFARLEKLGIKGIKVDFFQSDKQVIMKYYEGLAKDAADYHLLFNAHSSTIPRGWFRTFPNFISMEAVKGAEQYPQESYTRKAPMWNTVLPFTRNVIGSMDYTPVTFSDRGTANSEEPATANKDKSNARRLTTNAHELALSVVFECGIQHFADRATSILAQPKEVIQFLKDIPVAWDETYFVDGYPGQFVIFARKKGNDIFIGGINGGSSSKTVEFALDFLPQGTFSLNVIADGKSDREFNAYEQKINSKDKIAIKMLPYGGFTGLIKLNIIL